MGTSSATLHLSLGRAWPEVCTPSSSTPPLVLSKQVKQLTWNAGGHRREDREADPLSSQVNYCYLCFPKCLRPLTSILSSLPFSPLNSRNLCYLYRGRHLVGSVNEYHTARMEFGRARFSKELLYSPNWHLFVCNFPLVNLGWRCKTKTKQKLSL